MTLLSLKKVLFTFTALACAAIYAQATNVYDLRCEMLSNPWSIDNTKPHLSWKIEAEKQATEQTAYQILAASDKQLLSEEKADYGTVAKSNRRNQYGSIMQANCFHHVALYIGKYAYGAIKRKCHNGVKRLHSA